MENLAVVLDGRLSVQAGRIVNFEEDGLILVEITDGSMPIRTRFLRTTRDAPPLLQVGDAVLVAVEPEGAGGYVLGSVEPYHHVRVSSAAHRDVGTKSGIVDVVLPENARAVRVSASQIRLEAGDEIQITCGDGTISIDKRGKIVIRGTDVVSRARRSNKIKGASVAIN